ncbi:NACHT domain-containing protein [Sarocladium implicatum]|nr:NACHT domain-containing protein [Sarocladium implicatum]
MRFFHKFTDRRRAQNVSQDATGIGTSSWASARGEVSHEVEVSTNAVNRLQNQHSHSLPTRSQTHSSAVSRSPLSPEPSALAESSTIGLSVLYCPPHEHEADIVFVHGLGGTNRGTWTKSKDPSTFWPLEFLSIEPVIKDARISTFGYKAKFQPGTAKSTMSIHDFAKDLLSELKYGRDEDDTEGGGRGIGNRPIIFVVHSMGGLVVKEAYLQGQNDPHYEYIIKAVSAIIFLSTPHRGTTLAETLNRVLRASLIGSPRNFIAELNTNSTTLEMLNEHFRHAAPKLDIMSFYETRPTTIIGRKQVMVLEKDSSVLGYPGEVSKPLYADHNSICKYQSRLDPCYVAVRDVLMDMIKKAKTKASIIQANDLQTQMLALRETLAIPNAPDRDYNFFRGQWSHGTCSWILSDAAFAAWVGDCQSPEPRILCIQGNAASGKSILSTFVIQHLLAEGKLCHFFFIRFHDENKRSVSQMLRALAYQLAQGLPEYGSWLRQRSQSGIELNASDARTQWDLLLHDYFISHDREAPLYWIIDGLDEAEDPAVLAHVLTDLQRAKLPLRILITSRPTREINLSMKRLSRNVSLDVVNIEGNHGDIRKYVDENMDLAGDDAYQREIETRILQQAKGNFLWVHLAVEEINQCQTSRDVNQVLHDFLPGMDSMYASMARAVSKQAKMDDPTLGERILQWTAFSQRPLTTDELVAALGNDGILDLKRTIGQLCGGFVVVDETGVVTLIHETAREYLTREQMDTNTMKLEREATHDKLFLRCTALLMDPSLRNQANRNQSPTFLDYASSAWFYHLENGRSLNEEKFNSLIKFLESRQVLLWIHVIAKRRHLDVLLSASRSLRAIVNHARSVDHRASYTYQQDFALFESWAVDLVKLVGRFGTALLSTPDAIYKLIPPFCPKSSILYRQYGQQEERTLRVSGVSQEQWDDCIARLHLEDRAMPSTIQVTGGCIAILANKRNQAIIHLFTATTYEEMRRINHPERVHMMQIDGKGETLVSYGWKTTQVWSLATGKCLQTVQNPSTRPRPLSILFVECSRKVLLCSDDGCIRSINIHEGGEQWQILNAVKEKSLEDTLTILNSPLCAALSPEGDMVAFGYRGHPTTVWNLAINELARQCYVWSHGQSDTDRQVRTLGEVSKLAWHPTSGAIFGLQRDGLLFRWDTSEEDASATVHAGADYLDVNKQGSLIVTGDATGTLKIYTSSDLTLVHKIHSPDFLLGVAISLDSMLLYELRGSYATVRDSDAFVHWRQISELSDYRVHTSDGNGSTGTSDQVANTTFAGADVITAIAAQDTGLLYCYGTGQGVVALGEIGKGTLMEVQRSPSFMSIEHICWSDDGSLLASIDLGREITVRLVTKTATPGSRYEIRELVRTKFPHGFARIEQLLFQNKKHQLLAISSAELMVVDIEQDALRTVPLPRDLPMVKWVPHPTHEDQLLAFGIAQVYTFAWSSLEQIDVQTYNPSPLVVPEIASEPGVSHGAQSLQKHTETVRKVLICRGSPEVMVEIGRGPVRGNKLSMHLLFTLHTPSDKTGRLDGLAYKVIPQAIALRIGEPLAILSTGKLLFLDVEKWMCTWRLPSTPPRNSDLRRSSQKAASEMIDRRYLLPGDWIPGNEVALCAVTRKGTLICPRNGSIATVEYVRPF